MKRLTTYPLVKYPRTAHLPWSGATTADDITADDIIGFAGKNVVATVKLDGENTTMYSEEARVSDVLWSRGVNPSVVLNGSPWGYTKMYWCPFDGGGKLSIGAVKA